MITLIFFLGITVVSYYWFKPSIYVVNSEIDKKVLLFYNRAYGNILERKCKILFTYR